MIGNGLHLWVGGKLNVARNIFLILATLFFSSFALAHNKVDYKKIFGDIEKDYPVAEWIDHNGFYVGCHHGLNKVQLDKIAEVIEGFLSQY